MKRKKLYIFESTYVYITCGGGLLAEPNLYGRMNSYLIDHLDPELPKRNYGPPVEGGRMVILYGKLNINHDRDLHGCKVYSGVTEPTWDGTGDFPGDLVGTVYYHEGELCLVRDIDRSGMTNWEFILHEKYYKTVGAK